AARDEIAGEGMMMPAWLPVALLGATISDAAHLGRMPAEHSRRWVAQEEQPKTPVPPRRFLGRQGLRDIVRPPNVPPRPEQPPPGGPGAPQTPASPAAPPPNPASPAPNAPTSAPPPAPAPTPNAPVAPP